MTTIRIPSGTPELRTESARSQIAMSGWGAVLFGALFVGAGSVVVGKGIAGDDTGMHAPRAVVATMGLTFALVGLWVLVNGAGDVIRRNDAARRAAELPGEPWRWDYEWRAEGIADGARREMARDFGFALYIALFGAPFHWVGFFAPGNRWPFAISAVIMDLIALWLLSRGGRVLLMRRRYGAPMLRFRHFPFRRGGSVEVSLDSFGELSLLPHLDATLRCIQERYETRGSGTNRSTEVVCYALWSASRVIEKNRQGMYELTIDIPGDAPPSALSERPARFWELELKSPDVPGVDYSARFLVPVY